MWRIANKAVRLSMVHHFSLNCSMAGPTIRHTVRHATTGPECLGAQATRTGEDVETFIMHLERTRYRERADARSSFVVFLALFHEPI